MNSNGLDSCDWCGNRTNAIQTNGEVWLCPSCCPTIEDEDSVPDDAPPSWNHMSEEEKDDWNSGMTMSEIMEKHSWNIPPEPPDEIIH